MMFVGSGAAPRPSTPALCRPLPRGRWLPSSECVRRKIKMIKTTAEFLVESRAVAEDLCGAF